MAQWWKYSPPTNVAWVQIPASTPYVSSVCCWFSPQLREVFLWVLGFSPSPQKPTFPNSNSTRNQVDEEPLCGCATSRSLFIYYYSFIIYLLFIITITVLTTKIWATYLQMLPRQLLHLQWLLSFACFLAFLQKLSKDKKEHCWVCKLLLFIKLAKCLYRVHCILQKHSVLYDCMRKQIKVPSKWRCCWIRVSSRSCCWSCKIKCHEKSLNLCKS